MTTKISVYNLGPSVTASISAGGGPKIQTIVYPGNDTAVNTAGGDVVILTGSGFVTGCTIIVNGLSANSVTFNSSSNVQFTTAAQSSGGYPIYLVNPDGGTAIAVPGLQFSGVPSWSTAAGSLGSVYETTAFANTVTAVGDAPITYSVYSGSLPTGASLNSSNGYISGTSSATASPTTYNFTIRSTDGQNQDTDRAFSLTVNPDVVTWSSPANNVTYSVNQNSAISNVTLTATSAVGYGVQYAANTLPTGLTLSGNTISGTPTVVGNTNTLVTATANTTTRTAQQIINWVVSVGADTYMPYVTTLLSASNSANTFVQDASTNNFAVTINGDTKPNNFNPYKPGYYSNYFDGSGDYLTAPTNAAFTFGTSDFTIEGWVYILAAGDKGIFQQSPTGYFNASTTNSVALGINNTGTTWQIYAKNTSASSTATYSLNTWYHFALVRSSSTTTLYLNGTSIITVSADTTNYTGTYFGIGSIYGTSTTPINAYISNLRVVNGTAVYTAAFTPPASPLSAISNTSLLTCQSNRFIDNSTNAFTITRNGDTTINGFNPFTPNSSYATYGSTYFDGSGDYLTVADNTALESFGDFTIEFWVYFNSVTGSQVILDKGWNGASFSPYVILASSSSLIAYASSSGGSWDVLSASSFGTVAIGQWYHVALTRSGSTIRLFLNGTLSTSVTNSSTLMNSASALGIGGGPSAGANPLNGYISNLHIVKGTAIYTAAFTPPTSPLTTVANTQLLICQTNLPSNNSIFLDSSTNNFTAARFGNATQGTFSPYGEGWSNYFNGSTDYLSLASNAAYTFGTGDFTIEFWFCGPSQTNTFLYDNRGATQTGFIHITTGASTSTLRYGPTNTTGTIIIGNNIWHHCAITRSSNTVRLFVDGILDGTATDATNYSSNFSLLIGSNSYSAPSSLMTGSISNLRIIKGQALYTGTFTPSTSPLQPIANTQLLTCQSGSFVDNSPNNFTVTRNGSPSVQKFNPFNITTLSTPYYGAYFDGTGDYLTLPSNTAFNLNATFTAECWVYVTSLANDMGVWFNGTFGVDDNRIQLAIRTTGRIDVYAINTGSQNYYPQSNTGIISANTWYHTAVVSNGSTITLYVNGTSVASSSITGTPPTVNTFYVGYARSSATDKTMVGYISNFRIVKGQALYTTTFTPSTSPLTTTSQGATASNVSLLTCQSNTFIDNSTNNFTITANGDSKPTRFSPFTVSYSTAQPYSTSVIGGGIYLDGTGDYLTIPNSSTFAIPGDFTVEAWIYPRAAVQSGIFTKRSNASTAYGPICLDMNSNYTLTALISTTGTSWANITATTATVTPFQWNHVAVTRTGTTVYVFINGIIAQTLTISGALATNTDAIAIGARAAAGTSVFNGNIADVRFIPGTAVYTSNFVPTNAPLTAVKNTSLLLSGTSGGIYDASTQTVFETVGDTKINTAVVKFSGSSSMYFDGTGDYLTTASNINFTFGTGDFTIECWLYPTTNNQNCNFFDARPSATNGLYPNISLSASGNQVLWYTNSATQITAGTLSPNAWYHLAVVRNSGSTKIYINGTQSGGTYTDTNNYLCGAPVVLGAGSLTLGSTPYTGYISDFRVTKGYARYTANTSPPTSPFISR